MDTEGKDYHCVEAEGICEFMMNINGAACVHDTPSLEWTLRSTASDFFATSRSAEFQSIHAAHLLLNVAQWSSQGQFTSTMYNKCTMWYILLQRRTYNSWYLSIAYLVLTYLTIVTVLYSSFEVNQFGVAGFIEADHSGGRGH